MSDGAEGDCMAFPFSALPSDTTVCGEDIRPSVTKRRVAVRDRKDRSVLFPKPCIPFRGFRDLPKFLCRAGFLCPVPADNRTAFSSFSRTAAFAVFGRFCCRSAAADRTFTPSFSLRLSVLRTGPLSGECRIATDRFLSLGPSSRPTARHGSLPDRTSAR